MPSLRTLINILLHRLIKPFEFTQFLNQTPCCPQHPRKTIQILIKLNEPSINTLAGIQNVLNQRTQQTSPLSIQGHNNLHTTRQAMGNEKLVAQKPGTNWIGRG